jgi:hypothetical protein
MMRRARSSSSPDARLIKLLLRARRFNATLAQGEGVPFAALADREGVSRSYFTQLAINPRNYQAAVAVPAPVDPRAARTLTASDSAAD